MAVLSRQFRAESQAVHYAHSTMMNELEAMKLALEKLGTSTDEFENLALAKQVQFLTNDLVQQLTPHFRHEEATVLRTVADVSRELAAFAEAMKQEHIALEQGFAAYRALLGNLERAEDLGKVLAEIKQRGKTLVSDLQRHVNLEETELSGFL